MLEKMRHDSDIILEKMRHYSNTILEKIKHNNKNVLDGYIFIIKLDNDSNLISLTTKMYTRTVQITSSSCPYRCTN